MDDGGARRRDRALGRGRGRRRLDDAVADGGRAPRHARAAVCPQLPSPAPGDSGQRAAATPQDVALGAGAAPRGSPPAAGREGRGAPADAHTRAHGQHRPRHRDRHAPRAAVGAGVRIRRRAATFPPGLRRAAAGRSTCAQRHVLRGGSGALAGIARCGRGEFGAYGCAGVSRGTAAVGDGIVEATRRGHGREHDRGGERRRRPCARAAAAAPRGAGAAGAAGAGGRLPCDKSRRRRRGSRGSGPRPARDAARVVATAPTAHPAAIAAAAQVRLPRSSHPVNPGIPSACVGPTMKCVESTTGSTWVAVAGWSNADWAGTTPAMRRIQAAWRASTAWIASAKRGRWAT